jgi:uncharacterized membrane protein YhdT
MVIIVIYLVSKDDMLIKIPLYKQFACFQIQLLLIYL